MFFQKILSVPQGPSVVQPQRLARRFPARICQDHHLTAGDFPSAEPTEVARFPRGKWLAQMLSSSAHYLRFIHRYNVITQTEPHHTRMKTK